MKKIFFLLLFILVIVNGSYSAHQKIFNKLLSLRKKIDKIIQGSSAAQCFTGLKFVSLDDSLNIYEYNNDKLFHPASNLKIFTTAAALRLLDSNFQFVTKIVADPRIEDGILSGNLYVEGSGDPLITSENVDSIAGLIKAYNIQVITGNIIGDVSYFDDLYWGSGWMWDEEPEAYQAFISPLTVNGNSLEIIAEPGEKGGKAKISTNPSTNYFVCINNTVTSYDTSIPILNVTREKHNDTIYVSGRIRPGNELQKYSLSVWKPEEYFLALLKDKMLLHGTKIFGVTRFGTVNENKNLKIAKFSHPIDSVIYRINKFSDNLAAENLLKTIAAEIYGKPGSAAQGILIVKKYLSSIGIDTAKMIIADGSGLSSYNLVSPKSIVQLLEFIYSNKTMFTRFAKSLPVMGVDGTLKNRMNGTKAKGRVLAKTGTLNGTSALCGYITLLNGKCIAFSMIFNHFYGDRSVLRDIQDKILETILKANMPPK